MSYANCIGSGREDEGCGKVEGESGDICPHCGGMVLDDNDLEEAKELVKKWGEEEICNKKKKLKY